MALLALLMAGCGGEDGLDGDDAETLEVSSQPASPDDCPDGGTELTFGYDTSGDGEIDEVSHVQIVCDGATGPDGEDGEDGEDGLSVLVETSDATMGDCVAGGTIYTFGYDTTGDGEIDDVVSQQTVCDGYRSDELSSEALVFGKSVLYYADGTSTDGEGDVLVEGLEDLADAGLIELTVADSSQDFRDELSNSSFDVTFYFAQNNLVSSTDHDILVELVEGYGRLIFATYTTLSDDGLFDVLQTSFSGNTNHSTITFTSDRASEGLPDELALFTEPWNTHSVGLTPALGARSICEFDDGHSCAVLGNQGRTLHLGVFSDVFPVDHTEQIALNLLGTVLESAH